MYRGKRINPWWNDAEWPNANKRQRTARAITTRRGPYGRNYSPRTLSLAEHKFFDLDIDDATIAAGDTILQQSCNLIQQGSGDSDRTSRKVLVTSLSWRYVIKLDYQQGASQTSDLVRVILYQDKQCNGGAATAASILQTDDIMSFNNLSNKNRYRILHDAYHCMKSSVGAGNGTTDNYGEDLKYKAVYKKLNIPLEFIGNATTIIAYVTSNNIGVLVYSTDGNCSLSSKMRLRFVDT